MQAKKRCKTLTLNLNTFMGDFNCGVSATLSASNLTQILN